MSNKSSIPSLAKILVEKDGLEQTAAENFVKMVFDIANEAMQTDKLVKMRWLGSFKVLAVKDRESVDVNTGDRILIEGRDKISFTPDNILKEIVNKPFAQFETVTINEGVDFSEIDEKFALLEEKEEEEPASAEDKSEPEAEPYPASSRVEEEENTPLAKESILPNVEEETPLVEEPVSPNVEEEETHLAEESISPIVEKERPPVEESVLQKENEKVEKKENPLPRVDEASGRRSHVVIPRYVAVVACCVVLALVAGLGWFAFSYGKMSAQRDYLAHQRDFLTTQLNAAKHAQPAHKAVAVPSEEDSVQQELKRKAQEDSVRMAKVSEAIEPATSEKDNKKDDEKKEASKEKQETPETKTDAQQDKYDSDVRIRTGAYRIVGVAKKVKVSSGQTLESISKTYLGPGMECYIEALNGITKVTAGQEINIPKLELRKKTTK